MFFCTGSPRLCWMKEYSFVFVYCFFTDQVQVEQSVWCVCVCICLFIGTITFEQRYWACWFILTQPRSRSQVKVHNHGRKNVAKMVGVTSRQGFLVLYIFTSCLLYYKLQIMSYVTTFACEMGIIMAALRSRCAHYIFVLFLLLFFIPRLISAVVEWMSTILRHMMWTQCKFRMQV